MKILFTNNYRSAEKNGSKSKRHLFFVCYRTGACFVNNRAQLFIYFFMLNIFSLLIVDIFLEKPFSLTSSS